MSAVKHCANVLLNQWWLPVWGLSGAVAATLVANAVVLLGVGIAMASVGFRFDFASIWVAVLPLTLIVGWPIALLAVLFAFFMHREWKTWVNVALVRWGTVTASVSR